MSKAKKSPEAIEASENLWNKEHKLLYVEIEKVMVSDKPSSSALPYRADWTREDEAALIVRRAMGSDFPHATAKAIAREWMQQ
jgi:hypothetical protein